MADTGETMFEDPWEDYEFDTGVVCQECGGTGLAWEGWECEECDGLGYWDV